MAIHGAELRRGDPVQYEIAHIQYKGFVNQDRAMSDHVHIRVTEEDGEEKKNLTMLVPTWILDRA